MFGGAILEWLEAYQRWAILGFPLAIFTVWLALKGFFHIAAALNKHQEDR